MIGGQGMASELCYTVAGRATYSSYGVGPEFTYDFTLTVSNDCWGMEFLPAQAPDLRKRQTFDGSNLVAITYVNKAQAPNAWNDGWITVDNSRVPAPEPAVAPAVFVGFAAQFYLPQGTNGLLRPLWHPTREVNQTAFVRSDWDPLAGGGQLAEVIRWWYEPRKWDEMLGKHTAAEGNEKALLAVYRSVGRTSFLGRVFPTRCNLTGFAPDREDGKDKATPVHEIQVTNVILRSSVVDRLFDRRFKGVAIVTDYRRHSREPSRYSITNSAPPGF